MRFYIWQILYGPDKSQVANASPDRTGIVYEAETGKPLFRVVGDKSTVMGLYSSPDGIRIVTASSDQTEKLCDVADGIQLFTCNQVFFGAGGTMFTADGKHNSTTSKGGALRVYTLSVNEPIEPNSHVAPRQMSKVFAPRGVSAIDTFVCVLPEGPQTIPYLEK